MIKMLEQKERFMRIMVFFDLPTKTKPERHFASRFRLDLIKDGYSMMQLSIYSRVVKGLAGANKHSGRLKNLIPPRGSVRMLIVTEKQYAAMEILVGKMKKTNRNRCFYSENFVLKMEKSLKFQGLIRWVLYHR